MSELSSAEVCTQTGASYRQLDYWVRIGWVAPATPAQGSGSARRFTESQIAPIRALATLSAALWGDSAKLRAEVCRRIAAGETTVCVRRGASLVTITVEEETA